MPRVCIHGNIGVGKSSYIRSLQGVIKVEEPIEAWGESLQKYYDAIHGEGPEEDIVAFEEVVVKCRLAQYAQEGEGVYVYERSLSEMYHTFVQVLLRHHISKPELKHRLITLFEDAIAREPAFDKEIYLSQPVDILMERIQRRGRKEEQDITREYLTELQNLYEENYLSNDKCILK